MPGQKYAAGRKLDESDFELVAEDLTAAGKSKAFIVSRGRVMDVPARHKSVPIGRGETKSVPICIHGKLTTHACGTCEFEAAKLGGGQ